MTGILRAKFNFKEFLINKFRNEISLSSSVLFESGVLYGTQVYVKMEILDTHARSEVRVDF
jgi:hypothetical protein